jgi:hypothetical protein
MNESKRGKKGERWKGRHEGCKEKVKPGSKVEGMVGTEEGRKEGRKEK